MNKNVTFCELLLSKYLCTKSCLDLNIPMNVGTEFYMNAKEYECV